MTLLKRLRAAWSAFWSPPLEKALPDDEPDDTGLGERLSALGKRAMTGRDAYRCCVGANRKGQFVFYQLEDAVDFLYQAYLQQRPAEAFVAPAASVVSRVRLVFTPLLSLLGVDVSWLMGHAVTVEWPDPLRLPQTQTEVDMLKQWMRIGAETMRKMEPDCLDCCEKRVFGQSIPRKNFRLVGIKGPAGRIRRRVPGGSKP